MSHRGGGGRGRDNFNWSKPSNKAFRPRGLRGRDIGLYYRDQHIRGKKLPKGDIIIHLTIPPAIITILENNIESIKKLAEISKISIPRFSGLNLAKRENPTLENDFSSDVASSVITKKKNAVPKGKLKNIHLMSSPSTSANSYLGEDEYAKVKIENESNQMFSDHDATPMETIENVQTAQMDLAVKKEDASDQRQLSLRGAGDFKYGYEDIITGTFDEKLDECLAKGFRETLPTYKKSTELLEVINSNQVIVISGETGCGKSTQVPQLILDEAINNKKGAYVKILVTQPRRIAASSLAMRVAQERSESMGASVGYAVRLEKVDARARGSIMFFTTGILLATLEVDQGLTNYTHIILDEVHERDCDIDLAMFMLKKVLQKRKDLKLILMSATIDADTLSFYFNNSPMIHIEGFAYPVKDIYLEDVLEMTTFKLPFVDNKVQKNVKPWHRNKKKKLANEMEKEIQYRAEISPWLQSIKRKINHEVYQTLQDYRIEALNIDLIHDLLVHICKGPPGAILVFLPGIVDITKLLKAMSERKCFPNSNYEIYPLHSKLPSLQQHKIFERPPANVRKIIVATNIAETSITIDDIVYVIDSGKMKYSGLNVEENISTLETSWISQANLRQRRGRAGRCQPGICYHLLTSYRARTLDDRLLPGIQRDPLLEPVLAIKRLRLGIADEALKMMPAPPADRTVQSAIKHLQQCGALDYAEKLTPLGWHLARLPVHPAAGKLLLLGALFGCLNRAASVAAVWGFKDPFQLVIGKEEEVDEAKKMFSLGAGSDHIAISEAIMQWESLPSSYQKRDFAYDNFMANNTLELLFDMKTQFGDNLKQMGFLASGDILSSWENRNTDNLSLFKAIVAASLYPNIATAKWVNLNARNPNKVVRVKAKTPEDGFIYIHPSSVMAVKKPRRGHLPISPCMNPGASWLVYWRKQRSTELYLHEVTLVHTLPLLFFGELTVTEAENPDECYISITSVKVCCKIRTTELLFQMRGLLDQVLASKIGVSSTHATLQNPFEEQVLDAVIQLITAEEERADYLNDDDDPSESDNSEIESYTSGRR
ncbi:unnamed protein product [Arctia plantaginis]|uniref:ATP-dependent RNA helicase DHX36 n=1 Tax=Arctia plantaginis TaxID=874455 RepID=A0A8S1B1Z6_ARCPL|nr:unnamed protein product [Arctia plantaginis]